MTLIKQRKAIVITAITILVLFGAGIGYYLLSPSSMIAIDVNPSMEIHTNRLGEVVSIEPVNEDARQLMEGYLLTDKNLEAVVEDIVDRMILNGYLINEDTNEILISSDQNSNSDSLLSQVKTAFNNYLEQKQLAVDVLEQKVDMDSDSVETAHENKVSVGKMALIDKITANSSDVTKEELADATVKQIVQYAKDHNISLGELIRNYHAVENSNSIEAKSARTASADAVTSASVTPAPDAAAADDTTVTIKVKAGRDSDFDDEEDGDSDFEAASDENEDNEKAYVKESYKSRTVIKDREDADEDDSEDADSENEDGAKKAYNKAYVNKEDSTDAVSGATVRADKEDGSKVESGDFDEDNDEDNDEGNELKEDDEDNNFQGKEDQNDDSQGDEDEGGWYGDNEDED